MDEAADDAGRRVQLTELVAELYPAAAPRSFGGGAASFLAPQHLVVAHYGERLDDAQAGAPPPAQPSLFAA